MITVLVDPYLRGTDTKNNSVVHRGYVSVSLTPHSIRIPIFYTTLSVHSVPGVSSRHLCKAVHYPNQPACGNLNERRGGCLPDSISGAYPISNVVNAAISVSPIVESESLYRLSLLGGKSNELKVYSADSYGPTPINCRPSYIYKCPQRDSGTPAVGTRYNQSDTECLHDDIRSCTWRSKA